MITALEHLVVVTRDLQEAVRNYELLLGRVPAWRAHDDGVSSAIFTLPNGSLELIAATGNSAQADRVRAAIDAEGEGIASLAFRTDDIEHLHRKLERRGLNPDAIGEGASRDTSSGATVSWLRTRAARTATHGLRMFFMQMRSERPLSPESGDGGVAGFDHVVIHTPNPDRTVALYGGRLGIDLALDRLNAALGARFLFFRCGHVVIEIVHRTEGGNPQDPDRFGGICWRVGDADLAHARLASAGFDLSEVRTGRKPGTRVFTVRNRTSGIPTLMVQALPKRTV